MKPIITEAYLTENTFVSINKNSKDIKVALKEVTDYLVIPLLSIPLYEALLGDTVLTPKQAQLMEHVRYFTALRVEHILLFNLVTIGNKGVTQDEAMASLELVKAKRQDVEAKAGHVKKVILKFIQDNPSDFPEYCPEPSTVVAQKSGYSAGVVFDPKPTRYFL